MEFNMGDHGMGFFTHLTSKRNRGIQSGRETDVHMKEYPSIPHGYGCYVCGSYFKTNEERLSHLEKFRHMDLYDTGSPQEKEEIHRLCMLSYED
jgi:hypothetical protein